MTKLEFNRHTVHNSSNIFTKLWRNGPLWNALGSWMYAAVTFVTFFLVSQFKGAEEAGVFSLAFTTAQILYLIGLFGAHEYHTTDFRGEFSFKQYVNLRIMTCICMITACVTTIILLGFTGEKTELTIVLTIFMLINAMAELWQSQFFRCNRLDLSGQSLFFRNSAILVVFFIGLVMCHNVLTASIFVLVANLTLTLLFGPFRAKITARTEIPCIPRPLKSLYSACLPLFISTFMITLLPNCSKYIIDYQCNDTILGYFSMIIIPVQIVNMLASFIFRPSMCNVADCYTNKDSEGLKRILCNNVRYILYLTIICTIMTFLLGTKVFGLFYGVNLTQYRTELTVSILGGGLLALSTFGYYMLVIVRRQKFVCYSYIIATIACLILGVPLVRRYDIMGGIISIACAFTILCCLDGVMILFIIRGMHPCQKSQ